MSARNNPEKDVKVRPVEGTLLHPHLTQDKPNSGTKEKGSPDRVT